MMKRFRMDRPRFLYPQAMLSLVGVAFALFFSIHSANAHALLTRSSPDAGAELATAPATIEMWFSEPLESQFSSAQVFDTTGNEMPTGGSMVDGSDLTHLTLHLNSLQPGVYTIVYRSLSQADGHPWIGSFPLTILNADGTRPTGAQAMVKARTSENGVLPPPLQVISRWLSLLGAMLLLGTLLFRQIGAGVATFPAADTFQLALNQTLLMGIICAISALAVGGLLQMIGMAHALATDGRLSDLLLHTHTGNLLVGRQALVLIVVVWLLIRPRQLRQWGMLLLALAILATFSLASHAAAVAGRNWAMLGDFVHLTAAAIWLGGLVQLALLLWQLGFQADDTTRFALRQVVRRFSAMAVVAVFVLVCSGIFSTLVQLHPLSLLWSSLYGWVLLIKLLLMALAMGFALRNHRLVRNPQSTPAADWSAATYRTFLRQVWSETTVGFTLMLAVAVLVQTPIPLPAVAEKAPAYYENIFAADDLTVHMQILPNQVGNNQYVTHLYHADNTPIGDVQMVRLSFVSEEAELGQATLELTSQGGGLFSGEGAYLNRAGKWDVSVYVRRRGMDDILTKTVVDVPAPSSDKVSRDPWKNPLTR